MGIELKRSTFEQKQPLDPFTFSAKHPERAFPEFDIDLARKTLQQEKPDYDKLRFEEYNRLRTC